MAKAKSPKTIAVTVDVPLDELVKLALAGAGVAVTPEQLLEYYAANPKQLNGLVADILYAWTAANADEESDPEEFAGHYLNRKKLLKLGAVDQDPERGND